MTINININSNLSINININSNINITSTINISIWYTYIAIIFYTIFFILSSTSHSPPRHFLRNHRPSLTQYIVRRITISLPTLTPTTLFILVYHDTQYIPQPNPHQYIFHYITPINSCVNYFNQFIITTIPTFYYYLLTFTITHRLLIIIVTLLYGYSVDYASSQVTNG